MKKGGPLGALCFWVSLSEEFSHGSDRQQHGDPVVASR